MCFGCFFVNSFFILCKNWLVVVFALVVFCWFCVVWVKELVGFDVCFGCFLLILCGFGKRTCWLLCLLWLVFVDSVWFG